MTAKDAGNHGDGKKGKHNRKIIYGVAAAVFLLLLLFLILWLALRPSKPRLYLQDVSVHQLNLTAGTDLLTTVVQITLTARNPNDRAGIYYDCLDVAAVYKGQPITAPTGLPAGFQGHGDVAVWSPYLYGPAIPVGPYLSAALDYDSAAGLLTLDMRVDGSIRWKVGPWTSGHHHLQANCPVFVHVDHGNGKYGDAPPSFRFQQRTECYVDV